MKPRLLFWASLFGLALLSVLSLFVGVIDLSFYDLWNDPDAVQLFVVSRFPRTAAALICGSTLAIAGAVMQMLVRNKFVEPMTTGTGQGAALGILLAIIVLPDASIMIKIGAATLVALTTSLGFLAIVRKLPATQPLLVPLVGLIYGGILWAGMTFIAYQADLLQSVYTWLNGEFSGILQGRYELLWFAAGVGALTYFAADQFAIAGLGRTTSVNLGLNYGQTMLFGLIAVSLVSALTVTTVGIIPFVGLVVPNIVSTLAGDNLRSTLPTIAVMGAGLTLGSDILGRVLRHPFEIPVGTVFGVIGSVLFLWLLYRRPHRG